MLFPGFRVCGVAVVTVVISEVMTFVIWGELLRSGHTIPWAFQLRHFLVQFINEILLNCWGPLIEAVRESESHILLKAQIYLPQIYLTVIVLSSTRRVIYSGI
jgi:hypothetical protein